MQIIKKIASDPYNLDNENADLLEKVFNELSHTSKFNAVINESGDLIATFSDKSIHNFGNVTDTSGLTPDPSVSIEIINKNSISLRKLEKRATMKANDDGSATITYYNASK